MNEQTPCCRFWRGTNKFADVGVENTASGPTTESPVTAARHQIQSSSIFTGREDVLDSLQAFFTDRGPNKYARREYLLHGMGGAGKTQIAVKHAEACETRHLNHCPYLFVHH